MDIVTPEGIPPEILKIPWGEQEKLDRSFNNGRIENDQG